MSRWPLPPRPARSNPEPGSLLLLLLPAAGSARGRRRKQTP
ncbi:PEP-CTERM sorting domain-containing protein [Stenotrophomonas sepilia]